MLDWPGRVATTLFLSGCSFRCPFCHNAALLSPCAVPSDWERVVSHLESRRDWIDGVVVTGGEPTEDPDLPSLLAAVKDAGFAVKLDTNGSRPHVLALLLAEDLVDFVALDIKTVPERYSLVSPTADAAARALECAAMLIDSGIEHEFRTTAYPEVVTLAEIPEIARGLRGGRSYVLQQFRPSSTLEPAAAGVAPYPDATLRSAAAACAAFLPTVVRGASDPEE